MAYDKKLAERIRHRLKVVKRLEEKKMFGGIAFMVDGKMCVGVDKDDMILRCDPEETSALLKNKGARNFNLSSKPAMKGWLLIGVDGTKSQKDFEYWLDLALDFNKRAKATKKRT